MGMIGAFARSAAAACEENPELGEKVLSLVLLCLGIVGRRSASSAVSWVNRSSKSQRSPSVVSLERFSKVGRCRAGRGDPSGDGGGWGVMADGLALLAVNPPLGQSE